MCANNHKSERLGTGAETTGNKRQLKVSLSGHTKSASLPKEVQLIFIVQL